jgi:cyclopropane fatty-acyl-phospholipid synthase-like methyltransferase
MSDQATHPVMPTGDDLLGQEAIKASVRDAYRAVIGVRSTVAERLYDREQLALVPRGAMEQALGVSNPVRAAGLRPGEVVVDLGCGGGIDTILAAHAVAPAGKAIGLDMLPEMLEVAARNAAAAWAGRLSGALAERVFASKLQKVGFVEIQRG